jgi:hypothetical protein
MTLKLTASSEFAGGEGKVCAIVVTDVERNSINMRDAAFTVSNTTGIKDVTADGAVKGTYKYVGKDGNLIIKTAAGKEFNAIGGRTK